MHEDDDTVGGHEIEGEHGVFPRAAHVAPTSYENLGQLGQD